MYIIVALILCCTMSAVAQQKFAVLHSQLTKSQKEYINTHVDQKERSKYLSLIHFGNIILPKVFEEIKKMDSLFWQIGPNLNILTSFPSYGDIQGEIWKDSSVLYTFSLRSDRKLIVKTKSLANLDAGRRTIVQNFANWTHPVFEVQGMRLGKPTDHPFFLATKLSAGNIASIGFYYY